MEYAEPNSIEAIRLNYSEILNSFDFRTRLEPKGIFSSENSVLIMDPGTASNHGRYFRKELFYFHKR